MLSADDRSHVYKKTETIWKGIGRYISILFLAKFHLSHKKWLLIYQYKKKKSKIPSESEGIINFC